MRRLLIVGCGDVTLHMVARVPGRCRVFGLSHSPPRFAALHRLGVTPLRGDLDSPQTLEALAGLAHDAVHFAPPRGVHDTRTAHLIAALAKGQSLPQHLIYISTSGVYGDCNGEFVDEARPARRQTDRARRTILNARRRTPCLKPSTL
jgi:nucleoside-diphosphate-sugar epimerase